MTAPRLSDEVLRAHYEQAQKSALAWSIPSSYWADLLHELLAARALLRDIQKRDGMVHTDECWEFFHEKGCTCGLNKLEARIRAALPEAQP